MHWKISNQATVRSHLTRENKLFRSTIRARRKRRRRRRIEEEVREKGEMDSEQKRDKKRGG